MFWYVMFGFLAAFGFLCAIWAVWGLLSKGRVKCSMAVICPRGHEIAVIRRFCHLRQFGLTCSELTVLNTALSPEQQRYIHTRYPYIHFGTGRSWLAGQGREWFDYANGNGDSAGNHHGCGIPEL